MTILISVCGVIFGSLAWYLYNGAWLPIRMHQWLSERHQHKNKFGFVCEQCGLMHDEDSFHVVRLRETGPMSSVCHYCWRNLHHKQKET